MTFPAARRLHEICRHGVLPAMATPLTDSGYEIDLDRVPALVEFLLERGVRGLFVGGTTGEGLLLEPATRYRLHEAVVRAVGDRTAVLLHVGANTSAAARALAEHAAGLQPAGLVAIPPTFFGMPDAALLDFFQELAAMAPALPFLVYDIPQFAVNGISPGLLTRLQTSVPNFAGVKSSRRDAQVIRELIDTAAPETIVLAGNEAIALGSLAHGATGLISGLATALPEPFVALTAAVAAGELDVAQSWQRRINQILGLIPAGYRLGFIKELLRQRGVPVGRPVPPRPTPPVADYWSPIKALLD